MRRISCVCMIVVMIGLIGSIVGAQTIKNPDTVVMATLNSVETLDPQFMLSTATGGISLNVYESLLAHPEGNLEALAPSLASVVPSLDNGLITLAADGAAYVVFPIREDVKFHNGAILSGEDVAYTFKRALLVGATQHNFSMLATNLLGASSFKALVDEVGYDSAYDILDQSITVSGNTVTFNFPQPFVPFLSIMADGGAACGILNKAWCIEQGCWPGTKESGQDYMNQTIENDPLFDKMMGTGPYKLASWEPMERVVLDAFEEYWRGPAQMKRVIRKIVPDRQTAILLLRNGDIDIVEVSVEELLQVEGAPGIVVHKNLPAAWLMKINFVFDIAEGSSYIGNGVLGEDGIPTDFFTDLDLRKAFQYSFDWDTYINDVFLGAALKPYGPVLIGFPTANPDNPQYYFDLDKAREYFQSAWGGEVWEKGFRFTLPYSSGSDHRQRAIELLKMNVEALNPKFHIDIASLPWASYVGAVNVRQLPLTLMGLLPAAEDPYVTLFTHMHSAGTFAAIRSAFADLAREKFDALIDELASNYDLERRLEVSYELQRLDYEYSLAILHFQSVLHMAMRTWVHGYYAGALPFNVDFYTIWKANE
jgi:peptide/nickel transport system substrate-binding protein